MVSLSRAAFRRFESSVAARTWAWPGALVVLSPLVLFWELIFAGRALFWGIPLLQFYPWRAFAFEVLRSGHLPLWNPYLGTGAPLIANYQSAIFYPPNWIFLFVPVDLGLGWLAVAHVIFAGLGMVRLARRIGLGELGQAIAGLSFSLSGYIVARMGFITINNAVAWLPWLILAADRLAEERSRLALLRLALPLSMQLLAGHAQTCWYSALILAAWYAWRVGGRGGWFTAWGRFSLAMALAVGLSAIQLLPTFELLASSTRTSPEKYEFITTYSLWPWRLATLIAPDLFGNPAHGDYWGYGNYWEDAAYIGILPLLLALGALWTLLPRRKPRAPDPRRIAISPSLLPFLALVLVISLILALGKNTPVFPFLYRHVPPFNLFQAPARMMIAFIFAVALLAGVGAERWRRPEGRGLYWTRLGTAAGLAVSLGAGLGALALDVRVTFLRALAIAGAWTFGAGLLSLVRPAGESRGWALGVATFVAADLILAGWGLAPTVPTSAYRSRLASIEAVRAQLSGHRIYHSDADDYALKYERFFRFDSFDSTSDWAEVRESLLPNTALVDGIASANNFEPLLPERYERWMQALNAASPEVARQLLNLMDVRVVVAAGEGTASAGPVFSVQALNNSAERVRFLRSVRFVSNGEAALRSLTADDFDPDRVVVFEVDDPGLEMATLLGRLCRLSGFAQSAACRSPSLALPPSVRELAERLDVNLDVDLLRKRTSFFPPTRFGRARSVATRLGPVELTSNPNVVRIPVALAQAGYLLLSDLYYSGWRAYVDGQPVPILRADYLFRAVPVPAGEHVVEFQYRPLSFTLGAAVTGLTWLFVVSSLPWRVRPGCHVSRVTSNAAFDT